MRQLWNDLCGIISALTHATATVMGVGTYTIVGLYGIVAERAPAYLRVMGFTITLWMLIIPALIFIKAYMGWIWAVNAAAFIGVFLFSFIGVLWMPLVLLISLFLSATKVAKRFIGKEDVANDIEASKGAIKRFIRVIGVVLFAELMGALFVLITPFHQNPAGIPIFIFSVTAFAIANILWGEKIDGKIYIAISGLCVGITLLWIFLPQTFGVLATKSGTIDDSLSTTFNHTGKVALAGVILAFALAFGMNRARVPYLPGIIMVVLLAVGTYFIGAFLLFQDGFAKTGAILSGALSELNKPAQAPNGSNAGSMMDEWKKPAVVPNGVRRTLLAGKEYAFDFAPAGFEFVAKSGNVVVNNCDPACHDENGKLTDSTIWDLGKWYREHGQRHLRLSNTRNFRLSIKTERNLDIRTF